MPTYEYRCNSCEELFERFQKITDPPLRECPVCGGELTRLISGGIGVIFKGSGFYVTDSKSAKNSSFTPKDSDKKTEKKDDNKGGKDKGTSPVESTSEKTKSDK
jgi:putative FmdB family regulatory protein